MLLDIDKADALMQILFPDMYRSVKYEYSSYQGTVNKLYTVYLEDYGHKTSPNDFGEAIRMLIKDGRLTPNE